MTEQAFGFVTRLLAALMVPLGLTLAAITPTLIPSVFGTNFEHAQLYALIFLPAFALEIVLLGPATALMLADDELVATFRRIKSWTIAAALLYIPAIAWSLVASAALMVTVRVFSAAWMHVVVYRRTGMSAFGRWLWPVLATGASAATIAGLLALSLPETLPALGVELVSAVVVGVVVARQSGLVESRDLELVARAAPLFLRPLRLMQR